MFQQIKDCMAFWSMIFFLLGFILFLCRKLENLIRSFKVGEIKEKRVLITGCDSGFGYQLAKRLDSKGLYVIALCLHDHSCTRLKSESSSKLRAFQVDVSKEEEIEQLKCLLREELEEKGLHALVNNAGISSSEAVAEIYWLKVGDFQEVFNVNVYPIVNFCKQFLPYLKRAKGRIVNMSSAAAKLADPIETSIPYLTSKYAMAAYSDSLRILLKLNNIPVSVHIIEPGMFRTNFMNSQEIMARIYKGLDRIQEKKLRKIFTDVANDQAKTLRERLERKFPPDSTPVIDCYENAILSIWPKKRSSVNASGSILLSYCPSWLSDDILLDI
ncbi:DgyrCDS9690 [Dimorphilus gyrociliatus]|uniref:DgyrCDS9690 n=1 Tax=Dimorphilus gyrociliatus TaxID=2664684 RepID=A0A7I8VZ03_9ANNE|nr:DgyrCDS9690 [Dimorphilus gyrociliatus]